MSDPQFPLSLHVVSSFAACTLLLSLASAWALRVNAIVTQPYLDEVFHVRQAQAYCQGHFSQWDPKITTPPGLYVISWLGSKATRFLDCSLIGLRTVNIFALPVLWPLCSSVLNRSRWHADKSDNRIQVLPSLAHNNHTALNVCLFPPLFFFAALYYTDVVSTALVLTSHWVRTSTVFSHRPALRNATLITSGLIALCLRQTNMFWIAVFPAFLDIVDQMTKAIGAGALWLSSRSTQPHKRPHSARDGPGSKAKPTWLETVSKSWNGRMLFDLHVSDTGLDDILKIPTSIALSAVHHWRTVLLAAFPYLSLMMAFVAFIAWNGGVVLGDKANHIATLHLPQMLYIWPLITFFSWPLMYPRATGMLLPPSYLPEWMSTYQPSSRKEPPDTVESSERIGRRHLMMFRILLTAFFLVTALLVVHYNTIVHPFTLADNRHYVFYVFRILLRHPTIKYLAVPVYLLCGWLVLDGFRQVSLPSPSEVDGRRNEPFHERSSQMREAERGAAKPQTRPMDETRTSYVLAWLATTTMTLVTAPLVEPRYFILPWIFWRLSVPEPLRSDPDDLCQSETQATDADEDLKQNDKEFGTRQAQLFATEQAAQTSKGQRRQTEPSVWDWINHGDHRLWLETVWLIAIDAATGYIFLYKGFSWPQEPGRVQRFMW